MIVKIKGEARMPVWEARCDAGDLL